MNKPTDRDAFTKLGKQLSEIHSDQLSTQLQVFQSALINFANDHGDEIKLNSEFRSKFTELCLLIGIDPVELIIYEESKNKKHGDEYFISLSVKIVEVCQETRDLNGGLISFKELLPRIQNSASMSAKVTEADIDKSLSILSSLGRGYDVLDMNGKKWLKFSLASTSSSFTGDHTSIFEACSFMGGYVSYQLLRDNYGWDKVRCKHVLDDMIMNGFLWVDNQGPDGECLYWEPSWISN